MPQPVAILVRGMFKHTPRLLRSRGFKTDQEADLTCRPPVGTGAYFKLPVAMATLTSPMARVIWISRGQARVQLKTVWQR